MKVPITGNAELDAMTVRAAIIMTAKEIFAALSAPFPDDQVKTRMADKSGRKLSYITARTARHRLKQRARAARRRVADSKAGKWLNAVLKG